MLPRLAVRHRGHDDGGVVDDGRRRETRRGGSLLLLLARGNLPLEPFSSFARVALLVGNGGWRFRFGYVWVHRGGDRHAVPPLLDGLLHLLHDAPRLRVGVQSLGEDLQRLLLTLVLVAKRRPLGPVHAVPLPEPLGLEVLERIPRVVHVGHHLLPGESQVEAKVIALRLKRRVAAHLRKRLGGVLVQAE